MIFQTFKTLSDVNATNDLTALLVYVNEITNDKAMPTVLGAFWVVCFLGSIFAQMRITGYSRKDFSFAAASFATFGLAVLMSMRNGLLSPQYLLISLGAAILGAVWMYMSSD